MQIPYAGLIFVAGLVLAATPSLAADLPKGGMTANEIAVWLKQGGYPAEVKQDLSTPSDQIVATSTDGVDAEIYLFGCAGEGDARRCASIQYVTASAAAPNVTLAKVNAWNATHRYIKAYLADRNALYGEYDLDVSPGGAYEMLDESLRNWRGAIAEFKTFFAPAA